MASPIIRSLAGQLPLAVSREVQSRFSVLSLRPLSALAAAGLGLRPFSAHLASGMPGSPRIRTITTVGWQHAYPGQLASTRQFSRTFSTHKRATEAKWFDYIRDNKGKFSLLVAVGGSIGLFAFSDITIKDITIKIRDFIHITIIFIQQNFSNTDPPKPIESDSSKKKE